MQGTERSAGFKTASVPNNFLWGVSTAGYQWEGQDHTSQWAAWDAAGHTSERNPLGANGYVQYAEDAKLTRQLGCNAFRTSIEWARIEPQEGVIDQKEVAHYHALLNSLKANGLTPVVTLMHFSYPAWLDKDGGWENPKAADHFVKYASFIAKEFGNDIDMYLTFNEPNIFLMGGWLSNAMPPGKTDPIGGLKAMRNMVDAHCRAYDAIHRADPGAKVSFNMYTAEWALGRPKATTHEEKAEQTISSDTDFMDWSMGPDFAKGVKGKTRSSKVDFGCFDYYCKFHINLPFKFPRADTWEVYPEGFYNAIKRYHDRYGLPVLIAENGMATWDLAPRKDRWTRSAYMVQHVKQMQRAIADGIPVLGYIHWSITDNYEWGSFSPHFGLFTVDCRHGNFDRVEADGAQAFRSIISEGGVTDELEKRYPKPSLLPTPWNQGGSGTAVSVY
jgi:beta-glucosidase